MEYKQVDATSSSGSGNNKVNNLYSSAMDTLIRAITKLTSKSNWVRFKWPVGEAFKTGGAAHNTIQVVEFNGFRGNAFEVEMAEYLMENAVLLEKITFDTTSPPSKGMWHQFSEPESRIAARECAVELGKRLRPGVELVIVS